MTGVSQPLAIRLALHGCANRPFYHIVVMNKRRARNSKPREQLGTYDPVPNSRNQVLIGLNFDRIKYWVGKGAVPTKHVDQILGLCGFYPIHPMTSVTANRNREQALQSSKAGEASTDSVQAGSGTAS